MRLFVAVELPTPMVRLLEALARPDRRQVRWTAPDQWHITLRFLGEVHEEDLEAVVEAATGAASGLDGDEIEVELGPGTGWFPGRRVLQVPVSGLDVLVGRVRALTSMWGPHDEPPFAGHVTLARVRGRGPGPSDLAGAPIVGRFSPTDIGVFASSLGPDGASYERLASIPIARINRR